MANVSGEPVNVSVCRFCLCRPEPDGYKLIFPNKKSNRCKVVQNVIEQIMKIKVDNHAAKSQIMCLTCEDLLKTFQKFYNKVRNNEEIWKRCEIEAESPHSSNIIEEISQIDVKQEEPGELNDNTYELEVHEIVVTPTLIKEEIISEACPIVEDEDKKRRTGTTDPEKDKELSDFYDLSCKICDNSGRFKTFADYKRHAREEHGDRDPFIRCCGCKLTKRYNLVEHMAYHTQSNQLKCPVCDKLYTKRDILNFHIKQMHGSDEDKPYQCDVCLKRYVRFETLAIHMKVHLSKEEKAKLRIHKCDECDAVFSSKHNVKNHKKYKHQGQYAYFCTGCAKYYKTKLDYEIHRRNVHGDDGPDRAQCDLCSRWFSHEKALRVHIRDTHNPETPHVCTQCGHQTRSRQALRSHIKMKHEERKYQCEYCEKAFQTPRRLNEHVTVHVGGTLYSCVWCQKTFNSNSNMYKHLKAMHLAEWMKEKEMKASDPKYRGVGMGSMTVKEGLGSSPF